MMNTIFTSSISIGEYSAVVLAIDLILKHRKMSKRMDAQEKKIKKLYSDADKLLLKILACETTITNLRKHVQENIEKTGRVLTHCGEIIDRIEEFDEETDTRLKKLEEYVMPPAYEE